MPFLSCCFFLLSLFDDRNRSPNKYNVGARARAPHCFTRAGGVRNTRLFSSLREKCGLSVLILILIFFKLSESDLTRHDKEKKKRVRVIRQRSLGYHPNRVYIHI